MANHIRLQRVLRAIVARTLSARGLITRVILACALTTLASACGSNPSEPAPSPHPAEGTWSGSITDKAAGTGTVRVVLQYSSAQQTISGPFTMTFAGATVSGALNGPALAGELSETISCGGRSALGFMTMTPVGSRMQGNYLVLNDNCLPITEGTVDLTKQP